MIRLTMIALALAGCASVPDNGIKMTEVERQACVAEGCSVWTERELRQLIGVAMGRAKETCNRRDI